MVLARLGPRAQFWEWSSKNSRGKSSRRKPFSFLGVGRGQLPLPASMLITLRLPRKRRSRVAAPPLLPAAAAASINSRSRITPCVPPRNKSAQERARTHLYFWCLVQVLGGNPCCCCYCACVCNSIFRDRRFRRLLLLFRAPARERMVDSINGCGVWYIATVMD